MRGSSAMRGKGGVLVMTSERKRPGKIAYTHQLDWSPVWGQWWVTTKREGEAYSGEPLSCFLRHNPDGFVDGLAGDN